MEIKCALAIDNQNNFSDRYFGDAEKFMIYTWENDKLNFEELLINPHQQIQTKKDEDPAKKAQTIIRLLKIKNVNMLVAKQFGPAISFANAHFIPVIIAENHPHQVIALLEKRMDWMKDELANKSGDYMLFRIKNGVLKSQINTGISQLFREK
jgi:predicted Fe-Mo cluster-binding NifX family protein